MAGFRVRELSWAPAFAGVTEMILMLLTLVTSVVTNPLIAVRTRPYFKGLQCLNF